MALLMRLLKQASSLIFRDEYGCRVLGAWRRSPTTGFMLDWERLGRDVGTAHVEAWRASRGESWEWLTKQCRTPVAPTRDTLLAVEKWRLSVDLDRLTGPTPVWVSRRPSPSPDFPTMRSPHGDLTIGLGVAVAMDAVAHLMEAYVHAGVPSARLGTANRRFAEAGSPALIGPNSQELTSLSIAGNVLHQTPQQRAAYGFISGVSDRWVGILSAPIAPDRPPEPLFDVARPEDSEDDHSWEIWFDDVVAHEREREIAGIVEALQTVPGVTSVHHADRGVIWVWGTRATRKRLQAVVAERLVPPTEQVDV